MTEISNQMYELICKYCGNCKDRKCLAEVPWYCCSMDCKSFLEEKVEKKKRSPSIKRIMKRTLTDTF